MFLIEFRWPYPALHNKGIGEIAFDGFQKLLCFELGFEIAHHHHPVGLLIVFVGSYIAVPAGKSTLSFLHFRFINAKVDLYPVAIHFAIGAAMVLCFFLLQRLYFQKGLCLVFLPEHSRSLYYKNEKEKDRFHLVKIDKIPDLSYFRFR